VTYILGAKCIDGVVLVADKKVIYDGHRIRYQRKLFSIGDFTIIGAAGPVSSFEKFKAELELIVREYDINVEVNSFMKQIEEITQDVNDAYMHKLHREEFELLVAIHSPKTGITLQYVAPRGYSEEVTTYRAIGEGEQYGSVFLNQLWDEGISMVEAGELGYRIINYIEKLSLNDSVGVADHKPQVLFMTNDGKLREASDSLLNRLKTNSDVWIERVKNSIKEVYQPTLTVNGYICINKWGTYGFEPSKFFLTEGIDIDSRGNIYVVAEAPHCVQKFDAEGRFITSWGSEGTADGQFRVPYALATDSFDNVYVSESDNCRIQKFDSSGNFILKWGARGLAEGQFNAPYGLAIDKLSNVYVTEETNHRIQKFDSSGNFILKWGKEGSGDGEFQDPIGISTDNKNNVYVADHLNHRIQVFDGFGNFIMKWGTHGKADGQFDRPHGIAFDSLNVLYVTDSLNHRVQTFTDEGKFISKWGSEGSDVGQLRVPRDLVVDSSGKVYVSDGSNHRIQVFSPSWKHATDLDLFSQLRG